MMAVHLLLFGGILLLYLGQRLRWLHLPGMEDQRTRAAFYLLLLCCNALGFMMTAKSGGETVYSGEVTLDREESGAVSKTFVVDLMGKPTEISVLIPGKAAEDEGESVLGTVRTPAQRLLDEVQRENEARQDPKHYYLPESWEGQRLRWRSRPDSSGMAMALLGGAAGILLLILTEREQMERERRRQEQLLMQYPELLMKLTLLLQAGLTARSAVKRMVADESGELGTPRREAYRLLQLCCREMESGCSEPEAYRRFGERCGQARYRTLALLLTQNLRKGNERLVELLEREAQDAWEERRRRARVSGERAVNRLLVPMTLMLLVVMAVILIPAFFAFYGGT